MICSKRVWKAALVASNLEGKVVVVPADLFGGHLALSKTDLA
jgi:hypothetical protein